jgi:hypothetical protein
MKVILACVLLAGLAGCNLNITKITFDLPSETYSFDSAMWNLPAGNTQAVPCGSGQLVTDCCNPPAPSPQPDCAATPLACAADSSGASVCTAEIPESISSSIDLATQSGLGKYGSSSLVDISINSISYAVTNNTLNIDLPPVVIYLAPQNVTDPKDARATQFGTVPAIAAGTDPAGMIQLEANAPRTFQMYTANLSTPFDLIAATVVAVPSGSPVPSGAITITVTGSLSAQL